jgi:hypothetical protein
MRYGNAGNLQYRFPLYDVRAGKGVYFLLLLCLLQLELNKIALT